MAADAESLNKDAGQTADQQDEWADRPFLTLEQFVRLSGLSLSTVRRYLADGRLPKCQPGGHRCRVLIPRSALDHISPTAGPSREHCSQDTDASQQPVSSQHNSPRHHGPAPRWKQRR